MLITFILKATSCEWRARHCFIDRNTYRLAEQNKQLQDAAAVWAKPASFDTQSDNDVVSTNRRINRRKRAELIVPPVNLLIAQVYKCWPHVWNQVFFWLGAKNNKNKILNDLIKTIIQLSFENDSTWHINYENDWSFTSPGWLFNQISIQLKASK